MKQSSYKAYEDLPLFLNVKDLAEAIGIAPSSCYELMHACQTASEKNSTSTPRLANSAKPSSPR